MSPTEPAELRARSADPARRLDATSPRCSWPQRRRSSIISTGTASTGDAVWDPHGDSEWDPPRDAVDDVLLPLRTVHAIVIYPAGFPDEHHRVLE
jgi:hypothetical protein